MEYEIITSVERIELAKEIIKDAVTLKGGSMELRQRWFNQAVKEIAKHRGISRKLLYNVLENPTAVQKKLICLLLDNSGLVRETKGFKVYLSEDSTTYRESQPIKLVYGKYYY